MRTEHGRFVTIWTADGQRLAHSAYCRAWPSFILALIGFTIALGTFLYVLVSTVA